MDIPNKQDKQAASVAKNIIRQHHLITLMIGFLLGALVIALFHTHHNRAPEKHAAANDQTKLLILPPETNKPTVTKKNTATPNIKVVKIKAGDTLSKIFRNQHLSQSQLIAILALPKSKSILTNLKPGNELSFTIDQLKQLQSMQYQLNPATAIVVTRDKDQFKLKVHKLPIDNRQAYSHGEIKASLFSAGLKANLPSKLIMQMVDIFQWDIDFAKDIRPGDNFDVIYEERYINGVPVSKGNILAAEFTNRGKKYTAIRYTDPKGNAAYYTETGRSVKKMFTRTPVKFTRISSYFTLKRWHPVLHRFRKHTGVDYAAPAGTPIKATGDGKIAFIGRKGGYGNAIIIDHGNHVTTLYGHMLRFAKHMHKNTKVKQGQVIGYVGMTGLATGYHCHYEFRINNKYRDPLKVKLPKGRTVPKQYRNAFIAQRNRLLRRMETYHQTVLAENKTTK